MRRSVLLAALAALIVCGCGGPDRAAPPSRPQAPCNPAPGTGTMGVCVPKAKARASLPFFRATQLLPDVSEFTGCPTFRGRAIIRLYEAGIAREDSDARCDAAKLRALHVWFAGYIFNRPGSCTAQADIAVAIARSLGQPGPVIADAEVWLPPGFVVCFEHRVEADGYPAVEYTCPGCGDEQHGRIWIADYPTRPPGSWVAHQFSSEFWCAGIFGDCSVDEGIGAISRGPTRAELDRRWRAELALTNARIHALHALLKKHRCWTVHGPHAYGACPVWAAKGRREHVRATVLEALLRR